jgi:hypothetical protein
VKIIVSAETETWHSRLRDPDDEMDNGDTDGRVSNVTAWQDMSGKEYYSYGDSASADLPVKLGDIVYAVVADYSSGDTSGRSGGHAKVLDVFATPEEAEGLLKAAKADPVSSRFQDRYRFEHNGKEYTRVWMGHFEELNSLDVWDVAVGRHPQDRFRKGTGRYSAHKQGR